MNQTIEGSNPYPIRLNRYLAMCGVTSRRDAEKIIEKGKVTVNGSIITEPFYQVNEGDLVTAFGRDLAILEKRVFKFYKPTGIITSHDDPEGRETLFAFIRKLYPDLPRLISVGRLDFNSEGLMLLTTAGDFARHYENPENEIKRVYKVRVRGELTAENLTELAEGVTIRGFHYGPATVTACEACPPTISMKIPSIKKAESDENGEENVVPTCHTEATKEEEVSTCDAPEPVTTEEKESCGVNHWYEVILHEGKNREIRNLMEHYGLQVSRLIRTQYGEYEVKDLKSGAMVEVLDDNSEVAVTPTDNPIERAPRVYDRERSGGGGFNRGPRPEGSGFRDRSEGGFKPREGGGFNRGPRPEGGGFNRGGFGDRPRPEGGFRPRPEGGFRPRPEGGFRDRPEGGFRDRPEGGFRPRPEGGFRPRPEGGFGDRPRPEGGFRPRPEGGFGDRPRPEGGFRPRPEGGFRPRPEGGFGDRSRPEGGFRSRPEGGFRSRPEGGFGDRPRPEGGFGDRPRPEGGFRPRPEGGFRPRPEGGGFNRGPRPEGGGEFRPRPPRRDED